MRVRAVCFRHGEDFAERQVGGIQEQGRWGGVGGLRSGTSSVPLDGGQAYEVFHVAE